MDRPISDNPPVEPESFELYEVPADLARPEDLAGYTNPDYDTAEEATRRAVIRAELAERLARRQAEAMEREAGAMERARQQVTAYAEGRVAAQERAMANARAAEEASRAAEETARAQALIDARRRSWPERNWGIFLAIAGVLAVLLLADAHVPILSEFARWVRMLLFTGGSR